MGTNYYFGYVTNENWMHIGKVSSAGVYCFNCDITLCMDGISGIQSNLRTWYDHCPTCGTHYKELDIACSFTWSMEPLLFKAFLSQNKHVYNEYDNFISNEKMMTILNKNCPIKFYHSIGSEFC